MAVASARIDGMKDFRVVDATHTFIVRDREATALVIRFLEEGAFGPPAG